MKRRLNIKINGFLIAIFFVGIINIISKIILNIYTSPTQYGLNYNIFQPDGIYYYYRSLSLIGFSKSEAAFKAFSFYDANNLRNPVLVYQDLYSATNPIQNVVSPRILYPLLSAPFVKFLGAWGMFVLPSLCYLITIIFIYKIAFIRNSRTEALLITLALTLSSTFNRWMLVNYTDFLLVCLFTIVAYLLLQNSFISNLNFFIICILAALSSLTRFCFPYWLGISLFLLTKGYRNKSFVILLISIIFFFPSLKSNFQDFVLPETQLSFASKIFHLPLSAIKVFLFELAQILLIDKVFFILIFLAFVQMIHKIKDSNSIFLVIMLFCGFVIGGINGVLGVNFRYELPIIGVIISNIDIKNLLRRKYFDI